MTNKAFITAVSFDEAADIIRVAIANAEQRHIANLAISFDAPRQTSIFLTPLDDNEIEQLPYVNDAVFAAAVVATLNRHTTDATELPLVPDISEPLEIYF